MKTRIFALASISLALLIIPGISGQIILSETDSLAISVLGPDFQGMHYRFNDEIREDICISRLNSELLSISKKSGLRNIGNGVMTAITGIGFNSSEKASWEVTGNITSSRTPSAWKVSLCCEGYVETERERVKNEDGSWSVETNEVRVYEWDKDAFGFIVENSDTIGWFWIVMNPLENQYLEELAKGVLPGPDDKAGQSDNITVTVPWRPAKAPDYGIYGQLREKDFKFIHNGNDRKVWIFSADNFEAVYQADLTGKLIRKKFRITPYMLIDKNIEEQDRQDLPKLAMVSKILTASFTLE